MKQNTLSDLKLFFSYFKPHKGLFILDMCCAALIALVELAFPVLTRYTINELLPGNLYKAFFSMIAFMAGIYMLHTIANYLVTYLGHLFGVKVESDMRRDLFAHVERQSYTFFDNNRTGHIMSRITHDLFEITELAHHGPEDVFISVATLIGSFVIMLSIRWELAVIVFSVLPISIVYVMMSRKTLNGRSRVVKERTAAINANIESSISGARVTKVFTNEDFENEKFGEENNTYVEAKGSFYKTMAAFHSKIIFITNSMNVLVLAVGGYLIMNGRMNLADLIAANLFVSTFVQPIRRLSLFVEQYTVGMAGFRRFVELMNTHYETPELPGAEELPPVQGFIQYNDVSFSYNNSNKILDKVSFSVEPGQKVAFVGPSGGGKTTLCHLLPRFYEISGGSITIDGKDIRTVTVESLRRQIGLVQQDVFLFAGTIRENIAYGKIDATEEEIQAAAKRADIHDAIMKMPQGYDTVVGERGMKLSGGQKQRISIARIFLKNPPILILDEATSALDTSTEIKIQKAFDDLSVGRTTLVIAHRLSTIKNAQKILVVTDEGIVASGSHEELLSQGGLYKSLYEAQYL